MSIDDEKLKHVKNIMKSLAWLLENDSWEEVKEVMKYCVTKAANILAKEKNVDLDSVDFGERYEYLPDWHEVVEDALKRR